MKKTLLLAMPIALFAATTVATAAETTHTVAQASRKYTLITSLRFSEADLARIETVTLTGPTRLWDSWTTQAATPVKKEPVQTQSRIDWQGADGRTWSLSIEDLVRAGQLGANKPLVDLGRSFEGSSVLTDQEMVSLPIGNGRKGW